MGTFGGRAAAAFQRAADRARQVLEPGDRLLMCSACGGRGQTVTFVGWVDYRGQPDPLGTMFASKTLDDLSPWNIAKRNGVPVSFRDDHGEAAVAADQERFTREAAQNRAIVIQNRRRTIRAV